MDMYIFGKAGSDLHHRELRWLTRGPWWLTMEPRRLKIEPSRGSVADSHYFDENPDPP